MNYYGEIIESVHYTLDGGLILAETHYGTYGDFVRRITYSYDESGSPVSLIWNGTEYYYYKNIFGDILGIMDGTGTLVVRYTYDAWGRNISRTGSMASTLGYYNPFRYRSYYYDRETGLYYLQARYYDPTIGRFISPDPVLDTTNAVGCNPYVYCGNDPVNRIDPTGQFWDIVWDVVSIAWGIADVIMNYDDIWAWVGLCFDLIDLIPFVTCVGDAIRGVRIADKAIDAVDAAGDTVNAAKKVGKVADGVADGVADATKVTPSTTRGSTGRTTPKNLREQLAMEQVKSDPLSGKPLPKVKMNDPRWPSSEGWIKMQQIIETSQGSINIHYTYNPKLGIFDDFKFKS